MLKTHNKEIDEIMENFDFPFVLNVMTHTQWKWGKRVPTLEKIHLEALRLLEEVYNKYMDENWMGSIRCGGFKAEVWSDGDMELSFIIESVNTIS